MGFQVLVFPLACSEHAQQALLIKGLWIPCHKRRNPYHSWAKTGYANQVKPNLHRVGPFKRTSATPDSVTVQIYLPLSNVTQKFLKSQLLISLFKIALHYDRALKYYIFPKCLVYTQCLKPWSLSWPSVSCHLGLPQPLTLNSLLQALRATKE